MLHKNIPVTSVLRTLDDLSSVLPFKPFRRAVRNAFNRHLVTTAEIARAKSRPLRAIAADIVPTESILEDYVHDLIREAGFEEPLVNVPLGDYRPDFRWPHRALIVEADGAGTHEDRGPAPRAASGDVLGLLHSRRPKRPAPPAASRWSRAPWLTRFSSS